MVIHDFDFGRVAAPPYETNPPLVVNTDAVLPLAITVQSFQAVSWRRGKVPQFRSAVELQQFPPRNPLERLEPSDRQAVKQPFRIRAAEGFDHNVRVYRSPFNVKRKTETLAMVSMPLSA